MHVGNSQTAELNISKFILGETGTYNDLYQRPYQTRLGDQEYFAMRDMTSNFTNLEPETLANCAGEFLTPSSQPGGRININNGWGEQRLRFMMAVTFGGRFSTTEQIVTGYTDRADLSHNGTMDPNTQFFINNVITLRRVERNTGTGMASSANIVDNFQVLRESGSGDTVTLRPTDVIRTQGLKEAIGHVNEIHGARKPAGGSTFFDDGNTLFHDSRNGFGPSETTRLSRRRNNLSANYMSGLLKAHQTAQHDDVEYNTEETVLDKTQGQLAEPYALKNPLLKLLTHNTGFAENTSFTLSEIRELCPHVDNMMVLSRSSTTAQLIPNQRGQTEGWGGSDNTTLIANILASNIPALALEHLITKIWFTSTNETMTGETITELNHTVQNPVTSFTAGVDITPQIRAFLNRVTHFVMRDITHSNMMGVSISVRYDALGDTFVTVSCDGEPPVDYIVPTFCDSLFAPVVANNSEALYNISNDFGMLLDYSHGYDDPRGNQQAIITSPNQQSWSSNGWPTQPQQTVQPQQSPIGRTMFD